MSHFSTKKAKYFWEKIESTKKKYEKGQSASTIKTKGHCATVLLKKYQTHTHKGACKTEINLGAFKKH